MRKIIDIVGISVFNKYRSELRLIKVAESVLGSNIKIKTHIAVCAPIQLRNKMYKPHLTKLVTNFNAVKLKISDAVFIVKI